ncbi:MAG: hypothetical protein ICV60_19290 [Pyrinomonadaceae bacterium]|nr:hypothetical protein [Pyrinomonadaceae bacterium]
MSLKLEASLWAKAKASWDDLTRLLRLPSAKDFPLPLPGGNLDVYVSGSAITSTAPGASLGFEIRLEADYEINPNEVSFLGFRLGRACRLTFTGSAFPTASDSERTLATPRRLEGTLTVEVAAKLPPLPTFDGIRVRAGDAEGWTTLRLTAKVESNGSVTLTAEVLGRLEADVYFPVLLQSGQPLLHLELESVIIGIAVAQEKPGDPPDSKKNRFKLGGQLVVKNGRFRFKPQLAAPDIPVADYLKPLLDNLLIEGSVSATLSLSLDKKGHEQALSEAQTAAAENVDMTIKASLLLSKENPEFCICCKFKNMGQELRPLELLRRLTGTPEPIEGDAAPNAGLGFGLNGLCVCLSRDPSFAIEMVAKVGAEIPAYLKLTKSDVKIGLGRALPLAGGDSLRLPLRLPRISREGFGFLKDKPINKETRYARGARPLDLAIYEQIDRSNDSGGKGRYDELLEFYFNVVEQLSGIAPAGDEILIAYQEEDQWRVRPPAEPCANAGFGEVASINRDLPLQLAMGFIGERKANGTLQSSGELAVAYQVKGEDAWNLLLARPALEFVNFFFSLPFSNPRGIRVGGSIRFSVDGPLSDIRKFKLTVGLSADMIYFSLHVDEKTKIPLPPYKGDKGGSIAVGKLMFGFGYAKRSLAVAFAGELMLPEKLVDDLDTSDTLGAGIRLPVQSKLAFQFELMPIVIKEIVIPIPLFQFNWDLRKDISPGLRDERTCEPFWDGLQLIVPDVIRLSLKRISYSPMIVDHASSNSDFDGDLMLGNAENGLTVVADNIYWIYGLDSGAAVMMAPVLGLPFCDNFCVNLRLGGFGVQFNVQRPIPSLSPLAIFEILALLADPLYQIAPRGELADTARVSLLNAHIMLPEAVRRLFPQAEALLPKPLNVTINLATFLTLFQQALKTIKPVAEAALDAVRRGGHLAAELQRKAAELQATDLRTIALDILAHLPPEFRKVRLAAAFAGFDASAVLVLIDSNGARSALAGERPPISTAPQFMTNPNIRRVPGAPRMYDPSSPDANLLGGSEFEGFSASDLDDIPPPLSDALLDVEDMTEALANKLKTDDRPITRFLRDKFTPDLLAMLGEYGGGLLPGRLSRRLVGELNYLLKGENIFEAQRFATVHLEPLLRKLVEKHRTEPLQPQELLRVNRMLLEAAYPNELRTTTGILLGARVRVFGGQRFRFIGYVFADGAFSLVSEAGIDPLELSVAGIPLRLPFKVQGRLQLVGRAKRNGITGSVRAEGSTEWNVVPGLLYIRIGNEHPAALELFSDGSFAFSADASVTLFNNPGCRLLKANASISNTHCFISGSLDLVFGFVAGRRLFELHAKAEGRIGPGEQFHIGFATGTDEEADRATSGSFCGIPLASIKGAVSNSGAEIETQFKQGEWTTWPGVSIFQPPFKLANASLKGWLNLRKTHLPDFGLEGAMELHLFDDNGLRIKGQGGISSRNGQLAAFAEGALNWQGRDWLQGRIEIGNSSVTVSGESSFALDLLPTSLPAGIKVASLFFKMTIGGSFTLNASAGLAAFDIKLDWLMAARLPGAGNQILPLASQSFSKTGKADLDIHLVTISGFKLVPTATKIDVPIPNVTQRNYNLRVAWLDLSVLGVGFKVPIVEHNGFYMPPRPPGWQPPHEKDPPESWPIEMPTLDLDPENPGRVSLDFDLDMSFTARLKWNEKKLNLIIENGPQSISIPLDQAFPLKS